MKTVRNIDRIGMGLGLIVFVFGCVNVWAVVPYPLSPELEDADKVQAEKQEVIKGIEDLEKQDSKFINEIRNELNQMEEKDNNSLPNDEDHGERH